MADIITGATNIVSGAKTLVESGPASAIAGVKDAVSGAFGSLGKYLFSNSAKFPMPNPLHKYATWDYIISIGVLTKAELNNSSYISGKISTPLICKSANAESNNRINTSYGKFDFFVDNLSFESVIGLKKGANTNVTTFSFDVVEPYSMGMFMISLQQAAYQAGWTNYTSPCFLLKIEFRGNTEQGQMVTIPDTTRCFPFKLTTVKSKINQSGTVYSCEAINWSAQADATKHSTFKSDHAIKGSTVQEMLQTGEKSLQAVVNARLKQIQEEAKLPYPDEIVILFPEKPWTNSSQRSANDKPENDTKATASPTAEPGDAVFKKLGVTRSETNKTLVQATDECNALGKLSMKFSPNRKGTTPMGADNKVYNEKTGVNERANNTINYAESDFIFSQDTNITTAINKVLLQSELAEQCLNASMVSSTGMRGWWRIDHQVYIIDTDKNLKVTGDYPRLIVYRVVPYEVHASAASAVNTKPPGLEALKKQVVKEYDYIYTGKNVDILNFEMDLFASWQQIMAVDNFKRAQDVQTQDKTGAAKTPDNQKENIAGVVAGNAASKDSGIVPQSQIYAGTGTIADFWGGGGHETEATRAAELFHDILTKGVDQQILNMEILGDPYYLAHSGQANYTAEPATSNLNTDGTINWQNGQVHINVNFRTPIDINQGTGMYDFGAGSKTAPLLMYSGLYDIRTLTSNFKSGKFTQTLSGIRVKNQGLKEQATPEATYNTSVPLTEQMGPTNAAAQGQQPNNPLNVTPTASPTFGNMPSLSIGTAPRIPGVS